VAATTIIETRRNCNGESCNSNTNSVQWTVNPVPVAVATPSSQTFCSGGTTGIALSTSPTVAGTTFSWTVAGGTGTGGFSNGSGNSIAQTLTNTGAAPANVTYTITPTASGCAGTPITVVITVNPIANVVATPPSQAICNGGLTSIALSSTVTAAVFNWTVTGTAGTGGYVNGTGNSIAQVLTNSTGSPGTVTYVVTPSGHGCTGSPVNVAVTVNPTPAVTFNSFGGPYCISQTTPISLVPFASPAGGVFSGPGVAGNDFVPSLAAVGTNTITYTYTDGNSCVNTATTTVQVTGLPLVNFSGLSASGYCINNTTPVTLTGFPASPGTGVFSGTGVSGNTFTPSVAGVGLHAITYTYTDANGCVGTQTQSVNVFPLPTIGIFNIAPSYCIDDAPVTFTGFPPGGTFSGTATTSGGVFTPATAGVGGPYTISYQYTDGNGCTNTTTANTVVHPLPVVSFSGLAADYCVDAASVTLTGSPAGGTFSGPGITSGGVFTPSVAGLGIKTITYTYTNANGCTNSQSQNVEINGIPGVSFTGLSADYCIDAAAVTLTGNQAPNGTFSGPGITDNGNGTATFNPGTAGVGGPHSITYFYSTGTGCGAAQTQQVVVNPLPTMSFTGLSAAYCVDAAPVTLTGIHAPGGTFSGSGITDNANGTATFNPATAGSGPHSVTYSFTNTNGCFNSNSQNVTVNPTPVVSYTGFGNVCVDQPAQPLTGTPVGGVFSGTGVSGNAFYPTIAGVGTFPVTYTYTDGNGCDDFLTANFNVHDIPVVTLNPSSVQVCPGDVVTFLVAATGTSLSYQWQVNTGSGFVNINNGGVYSGVTTTALNVGPIASNMNGFQYRAVVTGATCGTLVYSNSAAINISTSPVITVQPVDQYVCAGDNAQFTTSASGSGLTYQWQMDTGSGWVNVTNGGAYSGATTATLAVSNYSAGMDGHLFRVIVSGSSNCTSSATSDVASLNGTTSPFIIDQPVSQSICDGGTTSFVVNAAGSGLVYQWEVNAGSGWSNVTNGGIYTGATSVALTLTGATAAVDGNQYRVRISNASCPDVSVSAEVTITITTSPAIAQQPVDVQVCAGDDATFSVVADGSGNTYQWQINTGSGFTNITNGGAYSGATTATLNLSGVTSGMDGHQFRVIVQNAQCASASVSAIATLTESVTPTIATQPMDGYYCEGDDVTFTASATGSSLTYQWQINTGSGWVNVNNNATYSGATTPSLTVSGTTAAMDGHLFRMFVSGSVNCSGTALTAVVSLIETNEPVILTQPIDQGVCENSGASFSAVAAGSVSYQWQLDSGSGFANITDGGIYSGATTATLSLSSVALADDGNQYRVIVSGVNCTGTTTSQIGTLTITDEPVIISQSPDQYVCTGDDAVFAVSVAGTGITYQWQEDSGIGFADIVNGGDYSGATTAVLTIMGATPVYNGNAYRVIVSSGNCTSSATSAVAYLYENSGPVVLTDPSNTQICPGDNALFAVSVGGTSLTYQWQVNTGSGFTNINDNATYSGSSTSSLLVQGVTAGMNNYQYRAVIAGSVNCAVDATSAYGVLTVSPNPTITQEPTDITYCDGDIASLTVAANGAQGYQWQENSGSGWVNLSNGGIYAGVNTATLTLSGVTVANDGYQYRVIVSGSSNCQGTSTSQVATITESSNPFIAQQPTDQYACPGDAATFTVSASGSGLAYQWQENSGSGFVNVANGGVYSGANTAYLVIADATGLDGNQYQVIITGTICTGSSTTIPVTLNETTSPAILTQPSDAYACANDNVSFAVSAGGSGLNYQWQVNTGSGFSNVTNGVLYSGATTAILTINGVLPGMDGNTYQVIVTGANCPDPNTSAIATLNISTGPSITVQPVNAAVCSGQPASFTYSAVGPNLTYQWQVNDGSGWANVANNATYSGATTPTLDISIATFAMDGYQYRAVVTGSVNCGQTATTSVVTLSVTHQPVANAGTGGTSCNFDFTFSAVPSAGVGTWTQVSGPGTSTYNNPNSPTATATATLEGQYVYQWQEVNGICSDLATVTVDFFNQPVANAGSGGNECDLDFNLNATASFGNGTWTQTSGPGTSTFTTPNNAISDVSVSVYGTYVFRWTEVNGACNDYDEVTVNFYEQPSANAGTGGDECDLNFLFNATLTTGTGVWSQTAGPGTSIYNLNTSPVATVTASLYGSYQYTWTETNGTCVSSAAVNVNFYEQPVANAGIGGNECDLDFVFNATLTSGTGVWSQTSGPGTPLFSDVTDPTSSVSVSQVGTYIFTWTETNGICVSTDAVTVNFYHQTVADAGNGGNECDLDFLLNAQPSFGVGTWTHTAGPGFANFIPNANAPNATAQVSQYGTYTFTWTEVDGICTSSDAINVNFYPQPVANAGPDGNECDLDHVFAAVPSAGIGTWTQLSGPGTSTFIDANSPTTTVSVDIYGTYVYQWEEVSGTCTSSDQMTVNYFLQPVADAGPDANECDLDHMLAAVLSSGNGTWAQSSGPGSAIFVNVSDPNSLVTVDAYGTYTFTWVEVNGTCSSTDAVTVNFYQQPVANAGSGGNECDLNFLFGAQPSFGTGAWTYTGPGIATFNNSTSPVATVTVNTYGTYVFTWTETNGSCVDDDAVTVNFYEQPVADAGTGGEECDLDFSLNATLTTGTGVWTQVSGTGLSTFSDATDPNANVNVTLVGTYMYTWTETNGVCLSTDQVTVNYYHQPVADAGNGGDECDLDFVLNAQPSFGVGTWTQTSGPGFANYLPNANDPNATVQVSQYGTYQFTWTEVDGICSSFDQITVNFYPQPVANAGPDADECDLDHVLVAVPSAGIGTWTQVFGSGTAVFSNPNSPTSLVTVDVYDTYAFVWEEVSGTCTDDDFVVVNFYEQPTAEAGFGGFECDLDFPLAAVPSVGIGTWTLASGPGTATFSDVNDPNALVTVTALGAYTFTWTEVNGTCVSSDNVLVTFEQQTTANAGSGGDECDLTFVFNAVPSFGTGVWTYTGPGTAFFTNPNSPTATVTVSVYGTYDFTWTETNGTCITSDAVTVNFYQQPLANAGSGGNECNLNFGFNATLSSGQGTWSQTTGPGTSTFSDASDPNAIVTVSQVGSYTFTWTEFNGVCFDDATVTVNFYAQPVADAGQGGSECDLDFTFNGSISTIGGTGIWTVTNGFGTVTFADATNPTTGVSVSAYGPYQFTWTETNGTCTSAASVVVNFYQQPVADAGVGGDECFLDFQLVAAPSVGTGQWTMTQGPGTAVFGNANSAFSLVTVNMAGIYEFAWTETNGTCVSSDAVTVDFWDQPTANAGVGGNECDLDFALNAIPNLGSGEWTQFSGPGTATFVSSTSANTTVSVDLFGTYVYRWTETNGVCVSSDDIIVNYYEQPVADAGQGGSECDLNFILNATASVGTGTWTQTSGPSFSSFSPNANDPAATVTVNQYGQYTFTWTEVNGTCSDAQTITVDFFQQPVANAGSVSNQCDLDITLAAVASAGTGTWTATGPGNTTFSDVNTPNATVTVDQFGTYTLTWTEVNGICSDAATVSVTFNALPVVSFTGLAATYCVDQTALVPLTGTPAGGTFSGAGMSGSNFIASAAPIGTHNITYTYTDANGCTDSETQSVDVNSIPVVSFTGLGAEYCVSFAELNPLSPTPAGGIFSGPGISGNDFDANAAGAGTHTITYTYTDPLGCTGTTQQTVIVHPLPVVSFTGLAADYCADVSVVTLTGTPTGGAFSGAGISGNTFNPTVAGTGIYTISYTYTDGNGCTNTASQSVNVNTLPQPVIVPSGTVEICQGSFVTLDAGAGYYQYIWSNNQNGQTTLVTQAGTYFVTVASEAGCQAISESVEVVVNALPVVNLGNDTTVCSGSFITLDAGNPGASYEWSTLEVTQQITVGTVGSYAVTVTDANGCSATDVISISEGGLISPIITANGPTTFCQGQSLTLNAGAGYASYLWSNSAQGQFIDVTAAGTYEVAVTDFSGCDGTATINITVNQLPNAVVVASGSTNLCQGASVTLTASNTFGTYQWLPGGQTTSSISVSQANTYTVTVTDPINGCSATSVPVVVTQAQGVQPTIVANGPLEFCVGGSVVLAVEPAGAFTSYLWSTGTTTPTVTITSSAEVGVSVLDANNCLNETLLANPTAITVWNPQPIVEQNQGTLAVINGPFQCYQWFRNGNPVPGATFSIFTPQFSGNHFVQVCDENGCYANSANIEFTVGIEDVQNLFEVNVYPNPNGGQFIVEADLGSHTDVTLVVRDVVGRALMQTERIEGVSSFRRTFDISHLANGIYYVQVAGNGGMTVRPVVKQ